MNRQKRTMTAGASMIACGAAALMTVIPASARTITLATCAAGALTAAARTDSMDGNSVTGNGAVTGSSGGANADVKGAGHCSGRPSLSPGCLN